MTSDMAPLEYTTPLSFATQPKYTSMTTAVLRTELKSRVATTNLVVPNIDKLTKPKLVAALLATPALGTHESYTLNALNMPLLDVEHAHDTLTGIEKTVSVRRLRADSLPILYVDGSTVMERVTDMTRLKRGDHVCVGLNGLRKISTLFDKSLQYLAHFEILGVYHHFIVYDDVDRVKDRVPITKQGTEVRICEYSNTPGGAFKQMFKYGLMSVLQSPAPFKMEPFSDYVEGLTNSSGKAVGMFRIREDLSESDRDQIVANCDRLLSSHETYSFIYRNCEHAAFAFNPNRPTWVSPQVPYLFWNLFRYAMNCVGIYFLVNNELPDRTDLLSSVTRYNLFLIGYHTLVTVPVALQSVIGLMRSVMALTKKRERDLVTKEIFFHLLYKEFFRSVLAGGLACVCLGLLPRMIWDTQQKKLAGALCLVAYSLSNSLYSFSCFAAVRMLKLTAGGVVVPIYGSSGSSPASAEMKRGRQAVARGSGKAKIRSSSAKGRSRSRSKSKGR